uniref:Uncharacterized protein n=1 Tax=Globodera rostochiensis TaxID=31243 RepID=A0A914GSC2_GLORO
MNDLYFFYSAKIAVVFILMLSSPTLEAQQNENEKFYDLMTAIGEHFGGKFNDAKKALELDLNAANSFLEGLHTFATREIVKKLENGKFELEAFVHGKNSDGTLKEKQENSKDKIQTFLAVPNCFPERETNVFGYWIEIIVMETEQSQKPIFGVGIYKEKYGKYKNERSKKQAVALSHRIYKILKHDNNDNVEEKILYLNNVHYELAINFEFNQLKDVHERASDLLSDWSASRERCSNRSTSISPYYRVFATEEHLKTAMRSLRREMSPKVADEMMWAPNWSRQTQKLLKT